MKMNNLLKIIAVVTCVLFTWTQVTLASDVYRIQVPEKMGAVSARYKGVGDETIVLVQDAHTSTEAQKHISEIITHLANTYALNTVNIEGAAGMINLDYYRKYPHKEVLATVTDAMLEKGILTGSEHAAIMTAQPVTLCGAEKKEQYLKNYHACATILAKKESCLEALDAIESCLQELKTDVLQGALRDINTLMSDYRSGHCSALDYLRGLFRLAEKNQYSIDPTTYVYTALFIEYANDESQKIEKRSMMDFSKLIAELEMLGSDMAFSFARTEKEKNIVRLDENIQVMRKMVALRALGHDITYYYTHKDTFTASFCAQVLLSHDTMIQEKFLEVQSTLRAVEQFYTLADDRSETLLDETLQGMQERHKKDGVLVTGGFHTEKIAALLQKRNMSYIIVDPKLDTLDETVPYDAIMTGTRSMYDTLLESAFSTLQRVITSAPLTNEIVKFITEKKFMIATQIAEVDQEIDQQIEQLKSNLAFTSVVQSVRTDAEAAGYTVDDITIEKVVCDAIKQYTLKLNDALVTISSSDLLDTADQPEVLTGEIRKNLHIDNIDTTVKDALDELDQDTFNAIVTSIKSIKEETLVEQPESAEATPSEKKKDTKDAVTAGTVLKNIIVAFMVSIGFMACGGSGGGSSDETPPVVDEQPAVRTNVHVESASAQSYSTLADVADVVPEAVAQSLDQDLFYPTDDVIDEEVNWVSSCVVDGYIVARYGDSIAIAAIGAWHEYEIYERDGNGAVIRKSESQGSTPTTYVAYYVNGASTPVVITQEAQLSAMGFTTGGDLVCDFMSIVIGDGRTMVALIIDTDGSVKFYVSTPVTYDDPPVRDNVQVMAATTDVFDSEDLALAVLPETLQAKITNNPFYPAAGETLSVDGKSFSGYRWASFFVAQQDNQYAIAVSGEKYNGTFSTTTDAKGNPVTVRDEVSVPVSYVWYFSDVTAEPVLIPGFGLDNLGFTNNGVLVCDYNGENAPNNLVGTDGVTQSQATTVTYNAAQSITPENETNAVLTIGDIQFIVTDGHRLVMYDTSTQVATVITQTGDLDNFSGRDFVLSIDNGNLIVTYTQNADGEEAVITISNLPVDIPYTVVPAENLAPLNADCSVVWGDYTFMYTDQHQVVAVYAAENKAYVLDADSGLASTGKNFDLKLINGKLVLVYTTKSGTSYQRTITNMPIDIPQNAVEINNDLDPENNIAYYEYETTDNHQYAFIFTDDNTVILRDVTANKAYVIAENIGRDADLSNLTVNPVSFYIQGGKLYLSYTQKGIGTERHIEIKTTVDLSGAAQPDLSPVYSIQYGEYEFRYTVSGAVIAVRLADTSDVTILRQNVGLNGIQGTHYLDFVNGSLVLYFIDVTTQQEQAVTIDTQGISIPADGVPIDDTLTPISNRTTATYENYQFIYTIYHELVVINTDDNTAKEINIESTVDVTKGHNYRLRLVDGKLILYFTLNNEEQEVSVALNEEFGIPEVGFAIESVNIPLNSNCVVAYDVHQFVLTEYQELVYVNSETKTAIVLNIQDVADLFGPSYVRATNVRLVLDLTHETLLVYYTPIGKTVETDPIEINLEALGIDLGPDRFPVNMVDNKAGTFVNPKHVVKIERVLEGPTSELGLHYTFPEANFPLTEDEIENGIQKPYKFCGWYKQLDNIDTSLYNFLEFQVKGGVGGELFKIELQASDGTIGSVLSSNFISVPKGASPYCFAVTDTWQTVRIPLAAFNMTDMTSISQINVVFDRASMAPNGVAPEGSIRIKGVVFGQGTINQLPIVRSGVQQTLNALGGGIADVSESGEGSSHVYEFATVGSREVFRLVMQVHFVEDLWAGMAFDFGEQLNTQLAEYDGIHFRGAIKDTNLDLKVECTVKFENDDNKYTIFKKLAYETNIDGKQHLIGDQVLLFDDFVVWYDNRWQVVSDLNMRIVSIEGAVSVVAEDTQEGSLYIDGLEFITVNEAGNLVVSAEMPTTTSLPTLLASATLLGIPGIGKKPNQPTIEGKLILMTSLDVLFKESTIVEDAAGNLSIALDDGADLETYVQIIRHAFDIIGMRVPDGMYAVIHAGSRDVKKVEALLDHIGLGDFFVVNDAVETPVDIIGTLAGVSEKELQLDAQGRLRFGYLTHDVNAQSAVQLAARGVTVVEGLPGDPIGLHFMLTRVIENVFLSKGISPIIRLDDKTREQLVELTKKHKLLRVISMAA